MLCSLEAKRYEERFAMSFNLILIDQLNKEKKKIISLDCSMVDVRS